MLISDRSSDVCSSDLRELLMTARTLRRRLLDEGTTYAELRDEVRQTLAEEFLSGPRMSIEQIAARLGYAEATSFINAFRRWSGDTPHAFRLARRSARSEEHTSELQSLMRNSYAVFCLKKKI